MKAAALLAIVVACGGSPPAPDAPASPWSTAMMLPVPRLEPGVTALGTQLVVLGGFDTDLQAGLEITKRVDVLDTFTNTYSQLPDAPVAWTHIQLAALGATLYLLGGLEGQVYTARGDAFALDTGLPGAAWRAIAPMPAGFERGSAAVVVAPSRVYLFGGASTTSALATNIYYDIIQDAWCPGTACGPGEPLPDLPQPRSHPAGMRMPDGTFVVAGGLSTLDSTSAQGDVFVLPPGATAWQTKAPMPQPRGGCAYGMVQGELVCAGGEAGMSALSSVELYDPYGDAWSAGAMMPAPRAGTQGAAIGQQLYVPGGAEQLVFVPTSTVFVFSPLNTAPGP